VGSFRLRESGITGEPSRPQAACQRESDSGASSTASGKLESSRAPGSMRRIVTGARRWSPLASNSIQVDDSLWASAYDDLALVQLRAPAS
jgi:hypothetical protein